MDMKKCFRCQQLLPLSQFYKHKGMTDGHLNKCKDCTKKDVRRRYHDPHTKPKIVAYDRHRQRKSFRRIFNHRYSSIKQRIEGRAIRAYKVEGKELPSKQEFLEWCQLPEILAQFTILHKAWESADFATALIPSIDRINNERGYSLDNIQWISKSDNSIKYNK